MAIDAVVAVVVIAVGWAILSADGANWPVDSRAPDGLAYALVVAANAPIAFRRRACEAALAIALVAELVYAARRYPPILAPAVPLIVYMAATRLDDRRSRVVLVVAAVASWIGATAGGRRDGSPVGPDRRRHVAARPLRADPAAARRRTSAASGGPGAGARRASHAGGRRGTAPHRPRAPRRPGSHDERGRRPGRHRPPGRRRPPRRGDQGLGRGGGDGEIGDARDAPDPHRAARRRRSRRLRQTRHPGWTISPPSSPR